MKPEKSVNYRLAHRKSYMIKHQKMIIINLSKYLSGEDSTLVSANSFFHSVLSIERLHNPANHASFVSKESYILIIAQNASLIHPTFEISERGPSSY